MSDQQDRRDYIKLGGAALAGAIVVGGGLQAFAPRTITETVTETEKQTITKTAEAVTQTQVLEADYLEGAYGDRYTKLSGPAADTLVFNGWPQLSPEDIFDPYTAMYGTKVEPTYISGAELLEKVKFPGHGVHSSFLAGTFQWAGVLRDDNYSWGRPLDLDLIPNYKEIHPYMRKNLVEAFHTDDDGNIYALPSVWGEDTAVYDYNKVEIEEKDATLERILFSDEFGTKNVSMPGDAFGKLQSVTCAGIVIGAKGRGTDPRIPGPFDMTDEELKEAEELLQNQKDTLIRRYWQSLGDLNDMIVAGEVSRGWGWRPVVNSLKQAGVDAKWASKPGNAVGWIAGPNVFTETPDAAVESAHALVNWIFGAHWGQEQARISYYKVAQTGMMKKALSSEKYAEVYPPVDIEDYMSNLVWQVDWTRAEDYTETMDRVLTS